MSILIVHMKKSGLTVPTDQLFNLSRSSKYYSLLSNEYTHLPLHKTKAKYQVNSVEEAVLRYKEDLINHLLKEKNSIEKPYRTLLLYLYNKYLELKLQNKDMYLGCWCKDEIIPSHYDHSCHCDIIKDLLLKKEKRSFSVNK